jgi:alkanesulfonate monooxygenase SsuD/methylene tetrahydromethanopterin reductase-like flavin-dependent oxidoreductase (luciferase family)
VPDGSFRPQELRDYLARAEQLGFASAWVTEQILGRIPHPNPAEILSFAAALNDSLRFGCAVYVTPAHSPVHLAKSISTLDQLSGGRLEVGVGIGGRGRVSGAFGVDPDDHLVTRFLEGINVMKALWTEPEATIDGRFWQLDHAPMEPKPFQKPYPPLWFGGSHPAALRRAVLNGDGFFGAGSSTTTKFVEQVGTVHSVLEETGRDPATFAIAKRVYIAVDDDSARARQRMSDALIAFYGEFGAQLLPVAVTGTPAQCAQGLQQVAGAGAELILLNPLFDLGEQMERLAAEVIPAVG